MSLFIYTNENAKTSAFMGVVCINSAEHRMIYCPFGVYLFSDASI